MSDSKQPPDDRKQAPDDRTQEPQPDANNPNIGEAPQTPMQNPSQRITPTDTTPRNYEASHTPYTQMRHTSHYSPNGTETVIFPDKRRIIARTDGSILKSFPNGAYVFKYPKGGTYDGLIIERDAADPPEAERQERRLYLDGRLQMKTPGGTVYDRSPSGTLTIDRGNDTVPDIFQPGYRSDLYLPQLSLRYERHPDYHPVKTHSTPVSSASSSYATSPQDQATGTSTNTVPNASTSPTVTSPHNLATETTNNTTPTVNTRNTTPIATTVNSPQVTPTHQANANASQHGVPFSHQGGTNVNQGHSPSPPNFGYAPQQTPPFANPHGRNTPGHRAPPPFHQYHATVPVPPHGRNTPVHQAPPPFHQFHPTAPAPAPPAAHPIPIFARAPASAHVHHLHPGMRVPATFGTNPSVPGNPQPSEASERARVILGDSAAPTLTPGTRSSPNALEHLLRNVLLLPVDSDIEQNLSQNGIASLEDILSLDMSYFGNPLFYYANRSNNNPVNIGRLNKIKILIWFNTANLKYNGYHAIDWDNVTTFEFNDFHSRHYARFAGINPIGTTPTRAGASALDTFKRGIKRNVSDYHAFKSDSEWITWSASVKTQSILHDTSDVLDPHFVPDPSDLDAKQTFELKCTFMYNVFNASVKTQAGSEIVRRFESTRNGQHVWYFLNERYTNSTNSKLLIDELRHKILSLKLNSTYSGTYESFIDKFVQLNRDYEGMTHPSDHFSDSAKVTMLHHALAGVSEFVLARTNFDMIADGTGIFPTYTQYVAKYRAMCANFDVKRVKAPSSRQANYTNLRFDEDPESSESSDEDEEDDLDYSVFATKSSTTKPTKRKPASTSKKATPRGDKDTKVKPKASKNAISKSSGKRVGLTKPIWESLNPQEQAGWDILSDSSKSRVLKYGMSLATNAPPPNAKLTVKMAETSEDNPDDDYVFDTPNDNLLQVYSAEISDTNSEDCLDELLDHLNPDHTDTRQVHSAQISYTVTKVNTSRTNGSLVDRGANGGLVGSDMRIINTTGRTINVNGIDNHQISNLDIVTAGAYMKSQRGPVIGIFHQYANIKTGKSIHSSGQLEQYESQVDDKSMKVGGCQRIITLDNYCFPLDIIDGLAYLQVRPYTDTEFSTLPHVIMTSDASWDPKSLDCTISTDNRWHDSIRQFESNTSSPFDEFGRYKHREEQDSNHHCLRDVNQHQLRTNQHQQMVNNTTVSPNEPDYDSLRKFFLWCTSDRVRRTYENTTQYGRRRTELGPTIRDTYKSPFPAFNVPRRHEPVATDTITASITAVGGYTCAQIFVGRNSHVIDMYPMRSPKEFPGTLEDVIRQRGAMDMLISDNGQNEISKRVRQILRALVIKDWQSEPRYQHQNYAERQWQIVKRQTHVILDRSGAPGNLWFLCMEYVAFILNRLSTTSLDGRAPLTVLNGQIPDISMIPTFTFYEKVYYKHYRKETVNFETLEELGYFVGFSEHCGHDLTFKVYNPETDKVVIRSRLRTFQDGEKNLRANLPPQITADTSPKPPNSGDAPRTRSRATAPREEPKEEDPPPTPHNKVLLVSPYDTKLADGKLLPTIDPEDLVGKSFLLNPNPDHQGAAVRIKFLLLIIKNQFQFN